ncbi:hypothetical protein [Luteimonas arsenica]|uniref:hypothetical protein n=1 Tax=Luteimonas arsenica TaxID=1586242 RepID=UPI00105453F5|nr:hypothetical protein [Luteimonas arsenica]
MNRIVDLELWSLPRTAASPLDGKYVAEECRVASGLPDDIVLGLNYVPSDTYVRNLASAFEDSASLAVQFSSFCQDRGLPTEKECPKSAAHFLAFWEGQPLAWLHFPSAPEGREMAIRVHEWAEKCGYAIRAGQGAPELSKIEIQAFWQY